MGGARYLNLEWFTSDDVDTSVTSKPACPCQRLSPDPRYLNLE